MNDNIGKRSSSLDIAFAKFSKDNPPKGKLIQEDVHNGPCHGWLSSRLMLSDATPFPTSWCSWIDINEHFCCHWLRQSQQATWGAASYGVFGQKKGNVFVKSGLPHWLMPFCWSPCCQGTAQCGIHEMKSELYVWLSPLLLALTEIHGGVVITMFTFLQTRSYFAATSSHVPEQEAMSTICCMHILCDLWMH